jgi:sugar lactone lactonase YvrE
MTDLRFIETPLSTLGEGPMWSEVEQCLYWIDVVGKRVFRLDDATGSVETRDLPYAPSAIYPDASGGFLLATKKGMARFDFRQGKLTSIAVEKVDFSREVFNDGICDSKGRLWIGTRDLNTREPVGSLYRIDPDYSVSVHDTGFVISNGMAFSPDARTLYHVESRPGRIDAYDFDVERGELSNRRTLTSYAPDEAPHPDGCTIDADGGLWVAEVDAYRIARYTPGGRLDRELKVPFRKPTSVMFGGKDLKTLYITSMRFRVGEDELARQPSTGALLAANTGFMGIAEHDFGRR